MAGWPRTEIDLRVRHMDVTVDGITMPVRSRRQLETLERTQGALSANVNGPDGRLLQGRTATSRTARRIGGVRPRLDVLGGGPDADAVTWITDQVSARGGRVLVVGGAVRDAVRNTYGHGHHQSKDLDVEVYGIDPDTLAALLARRFRVDETGRSFAVFKLAGHDIDVALPRRETRTGSGHRAFDVTPDPTMDPETAALRRDFTINAIGYDVATATIIDPVGGLADLAARKLRVVSDAFDEDPLRVLRGAQFIARFDLAATADTIARCHKLLPEAADLPRERIWDEWQKLLLKADAPGSGLTFLHHTGWTSVWPHLHDLGPHGTAAAAAALDNWATSRPDDRDGAMVTGLAVLTHALAPDAAQQTVSQLCALADLPSAARMLVGELPTVATAHAARHHEQSDATLRHLAARVGRIDRLSVVAAAAGHTEVAHWLSQSAARIGVLDRRPEPLVRGQDLVDAGIRPGRHIGQALETVYRAQLDGTVTSAADALRMAVEHAQGGHVR